MEIRTIGVVGAGRMASGIAQVCVQNGLEVILFDETEEALGWAEDSILRGLHRAEQPAAFSLLRKATDLRRLESCDIVLECVSYDPEVKRALLRQLDARIAPDKILAVETAALPVESLASAIENPDRLIGLHFYQPVPIMGLVEVIRPTHASEAAAAIAVDWVERLGKTAVRCKDSPGFIVNRIARPFLLSSEGLVESGRSTPVDVDKALREVGRFPMGPFEMLDFAGLENEFIITRLVYEMLGRPDRLRPSALEQKLIARGCRGRSNGKGFYVYGDNPPGTVNPLLGELAGKSAKAKASPREILETVMKAVFIEARAVQGDGIASAEDIDTAMRLSLAWPKGPLEWEKEF